MTRSTRTARRFAPLAAALATLLVAPTGASQEAPPAGEPEVAAAPAAPVDNEEIVRRFTAEVYNEQQLDRIPRYVAESFVDHSPGTPPGPHGPDFVRSQAEQTFAGMPDTHFEIEHLFSEGDMVAMHWRVLGTASAAFGGGGAEGRKIDVEGISIFRMEDGKIAESWDIVDRLTLFQQAGFRVIGPPAARQAPEEGEPQTPRPEEGSGEQDGRAESEDEADAPPEDGPPENTTAGAPRG